MEPGKIAIAPGKELDLRLLAEPEDAEAEEAHQIHADAGRQAKQRSPQVALAVDAFNGRHANVEDEKRHGKGEEPVAQSRQAFQALAGDPVVGGCHGRQSSPGTLLTQASFHLWEDRCVPPRMTPLDADGRTRGTR